MASKVDAREERLKTELAGVGLFVGGLFALASLILHAQYSHAYIPAAVSDALRFLVGSGAYLVGVALLVLGLFALVGATQVLNGRILGAVSLFFLCFLLARHVGVPRGAEFDPVAIHRGGGVIGATLWWGADRTLGSVCTWVVIAGVLLAAGVLFTQGQAMASAGVLAKGAGIGGRWLAGRVRAGKAGLERRREESAAKPKPSPKPQESPPPGGSHIINIVGEAKAEESESPVPAEPEPAEAPPEPVERPVTAVSAPPEPLSDPIPLPKVSPPRRAKAVPQTPSIPSPADYHRPEQLSLLSSKELYQPPPLSLISAIHPENGTPEDAAQMEARIALLEDTLQSFGIPSKVRHYVRGPAVTRYEVEPVRGIRVSRVASLADDLALAFAAAHVRVEAPVQGKALIGIEVPNAEVEIVGLRSILENDAYRRAKSLLVVGIGEDIAGTPVLADLSRMPHLLIAGATNAGKTICLHSIITSLLMRARPEQVKLILIDPKRVELMLYDGIPHLMAPVV